MPHYIIIRDILPIVRFIQTYSKHVITFTTTEYPASFTAITIISFPIGIQKFQKFEMKFYFTTL